MSKRSTFTTITPLPPPVTREVVLDMLHNHLEMIDLNPLVKERHPIDPPSYAPPDEQACQWYSMTDRISYLPGFQGDVTYTCAFHHLPTGLQTHCYAPARLDIRDKWTINGSLPGEPAQPVELGIGAPPSGLYLREDVDMRCNVVMSSFVKRTLKRSHAALVARLQAKAHPASALPDADARYRKPTSSDRLSLVVDVSSANTSWPKDATLMKARHMSLQPSLPVACATSLEATADQLQKMRRQYEEPHVPQKQQQQQQQHENLSPDPTSAYPLETAVWNDMPWPPVLDQHPDYPQLNPYEKDASSRPIVDDQPVPPAPTREAPSPPEMLCRLDAPPLRTLHGREYIVAQQQLEPNPTDRNVRSCGR